MGLCVQRGDAARCSVLFGRLDGKRTGFKQRESDGFEKLHECIFAALLHPRTVFTRHRNGTVPIFSSFNVTLGSAVAPRWSKILRMALRFALCDTITECHRAAQQWQRATRSAHSIACSQPACCILSPRAALLSPAMQQKVSCRRQAAAAISQAGKGYISSLTAGRATVGKLA